MKKTPGCLGWLAIGRCKKTCLGGGNSNIFLVSSLSLGFHDPIWRGCFSDGLKPPPSFQLKRTHLDLGCLLDICRASNTTQLYGEFMDPYEPTRISWYVGQGFWTLLTCFQQERTSGCVVKFLIFLKKYSPRFFWADDPIWLAHILPKWVVQPPTRWGGPVFWLGKITSRIYFFSWLYIYIIYIYIIYMIYICMLRTYYWSNWSTKLLVKGVNSIPPSPRPTQF